MNVRMLKAGWTVGRHDYTTYDCVYVVGNVKASPWKSVSRCVHVKDYEARRAAIEKSVHEGMGLSIVQELIKGLK